MKLPTVAIALALLLSPHAGIAAIRTIDLTFNGIDWEDNGTPASATVRLEFDSLADVNPDPIIGTYTASVSLFSGGSSGHASSPSAITVQNDPGGDVFAMSEVTFTQPVVVDGQAVNAVAFALIATNGNMFYHGGQINFVQLLLGDKESHIPPAAFK